MGSFRQNNCNASKDNINASGSAGEGGQPLLSHFRSNTAARGAGLLKDFITDNTTASTKDRLSLNRVRREQISSLRTSFGDSLT